MRKAARWGRFLGDYLSAFLFLSASIMRRTASSRLMGFIGSDSSSFHTSSGSRSSNGLRKLTGAPVAGNFGFCGFSDIEGEELVFNIRQSYEKRKYICIEPDEGKDFRVTGKTTGGQPNRPWIMLHLRNALHPNTPRLHPGLHSAQVDVRGEVKVFHKRKVKCERQWKWQQTSKRVDDL